MRFPLRLFVVLILSQYGMDVSLGSPKRAGALTTNPVS